MRKEFTIGQGLAAEAIREIDRWLAAAGIPRTSKRGGVPLGASVFKRFLRRFGVARIGIDRGSLYVQQNGTWQLIVHRDDVGAWLFGRRVELKVGEEPDPAEKGVEVRVGVMKATVKAGEDGVLGTEDDLVDIRPVPVVEYEEIQNSKGETIFRCTACGLRRKDEQVVIAHIERSH